MAELWQNWQEFNQTIQGKKIIFFGVAENWFKKTFQSSRPDLVYIVDNDETKQQQKTYLVKELGALVEVKPPRVLKEKAGDEYIVITSGAYASIIPELLAMGFRAGADFCCSPALNNLKVVADFEACKTKLLICSPDHKIYSELDQKSGIGGGLYLYDLATRSATKLLEGSFHQIVPKGDEYVIVDENKGAFVLDNDWHVKHEFGFEPNAVFHGLVYDEARQLIFLSASGLDKIVVYDARDYAHATDIAISPKTKFQSDQHHVNDLCIRGTYLYVTLFSHSGAYKQGIYDGGVLEINLDDYNERHVLVRDAWMPHNPKFINNELYYLDSMNSRLYRGTREVIGEFSGFLRGLDFDGRFFYIGQSESRVFDELKGLKNYISLNAGFYLFDPDSKAGRFFTIEGVRQVRNLMIY